MARRTNSPKMNKAREDWLDVAKGLAIVLVVIGHAVGGLIDGPAWAHNGALADVFLVIYFVHMPMFMILSGLTVVQRIESSPGKFGRNLAKNVLWPYLLWSVVQISVISAAGQLVNAPLSDPLKAISRLWANSPSQFWFLYALFFLHLGALVLVRLAGRMAAFAVFLAASTLVLWADLSAVWQVTLMNAPWYALGLAIGLGRASQALLSVGRGLKLALVPALAALAIFSAYTYAQTHHLPSIESGTAAAIARVAWGGYAAPAALLGSLALVCVAHALPVTVRSFWAILGQLSMSIFVLHVMFGAGTRIVIQRLFGPTDTWLLLAVICTAGILLPLLIVRIVSNWRHHEWLGLGTWPGSRTEASRTPTLVP
jgi:fucose 4-O-acetylase-like acetyltransferase